MRHASSTRAVHAALPSLCASAASAARSARVARERREHFEQRAARRAHEVEVAAERLADRARRRERRAPLGAARVGDGLEREQRGRVDAERGRDARDDGRRVLREDRAVVGRLVRDARRAGVELDVHGRAAVARARSSRRARTVTGGADQ